MGKVVAAHLKGEAQMKYRFRVLAVLCLMLCPHLADAQAGSAPPNGIPRPQVAAPAAHDCESVGFSNSDFWPQEIARLCHLVQSKKIRDFLVSSGAIENRIDSLLESGKVTDAMILQAREVADWQDIAPKTILASSALLQLARLLVDYNKRPADAENFYRTALQWRAQEFGPDDPRAAQILAELGNFLATQGRSDDAEKLFPLAVANRAINSGPRDEQSAMNFRVLDHVLLREKRLCTLASNLQKYAEGEPICADVVGTLEAIHPQMIEQFDAELTYLGVWTSILFELGRLDDEQDAYQRALEVANNDYGRDSLPVAAVETRFASFLTNSSSSFVKAQTLLQHAVSLWERSSNQTPTAAHERAITINELGMLFLMEGRYADAAPLFSRAREQFKTLDRLDEVAATLNNLAIADFWDKNYKEAERSIDQALQILNKGPQSGALARSLRTLGGILALQGKYAAALPYLEQSSKILSVPPWSALPGAGLAISEMWQAYVLVYLRHAAEAIPLAKDALDIDSKWLGPQSPNAVEDLSVLALATTQAGDVDHGKKIAEHALRTMEQLNRRALDLRDEEAKGKLGLQLLRPRELIGILVRPEGATSTAWLDEAFELGDQLRAPEAQAALNQAAMRAATRDPATARLARDVEDMMRKEESIDSKLAATGATHEMDRTRLLQESEDIERTFVASLGQLQAALPTYREIVVPHAVTLDEVSHLLRADEALVSYMALDDRLLIWVLRSGKPLALYMEEGVSPSALASEVTQFRGSVDNSRFDKKGAPRGFLVPVDLERGHSLYAELIAPLTPLLAGITHLIIIPDDTLVSLPFAALVIRSDGTAYQQLVQRRVLFQRDKPADQREMARYADVPWLAKQYAVTVLPSATSLRMLRAIPHALRRPAQPFIGIGDPVLAGDCGPSRSTMLAVHGEAGNMDEIRDLPRLCGTREELQAVAHSLGADPSQSLRLDEQATKPEVLRLDREGRLGAAAILAFATHGLIAGDIRGLRQPALVLTPPDKASEDDDGLLRLDDIVGLHLDNTEWVVLSACNTAAPDGTNEGLSGLVRAFFYAGAPRLLVSHWSVDDQATETLMSALFKLYGENQTLAPDQALQRAMLTVIQLGTKDNELAYFSHPYAWAPFFLVGEGQRSPLGQNTVTGAQ
jgi:CHAT domain-containing protein/Tfp pilus assembly protein PilF